MFFCILFCTFIFVKSCFFFYSQNYMYSKVLQIHSEMLHEFSESSGVFSPPTHTIYQKLCCLFTSIFFVYNLFIKTVYLFFSATV